jgi:hypothetical protein
MGDIQGPEKINNICRKTIHKGLMGRGFTVYAGAVGLLSFLGTLPFLAGGSPCPSGGMHSMQIDFLCSKVTRMPVFVKETNCVHHFVWETLASCPSLVIYCSEKQ